MMQDRNAIRVRNAFVWFSGRRAVVRIESRRPCACFLFSFSDNVTAVVVILFFPALTPYIATCLKPSILLRFTSTQIDLKFYFECVPFVFLTFLCFTFRSPKSVWRRRRH